MKPVFGLGLTDIVLTKWACACMSSPTGLRMVRLKYVESVSYLRYNKRGAFGLNEDRYAKYFENFNFGCM